MVSNTNGRPRNNDHNNNDNEEEEEEKGKGNHSLNVCSIPGLVPSSFDRHIHASLEQTYEINIYLSALQMKKDWKISTGFGQKCIPGNLSKMNLTEGK